MTEKTRKRRIAILLAGMVVVGIVAAIYLPKQRGAKEFVNSPPEGSYSVAEAKQKAGTFGTNVSPANENLEHLIARLKAAKAGVERHAAQESAKQTLEAKAAEAAKKASTPPPETQMSAADFLGEFNEAVAKGDSAAVSALLQNVPRSAECVEPLKGFVTAPGSSKDMRRYAAEGLVRIGTQESIGFVLDQARAAQAAGDSSLASTLLYSLEAPTTVEGAKVLFDLLLGTGRYADNRETLPEAFRSAARKALRNAPDREGIGNLAARLYLDPQISGRNEALVELFGGVSHPNMLSSLAVQAYQAGAPESATQFLNQLGQVSEQGTVQAMVEVASREPALLNDAAERLYGWSLQHPQQAAPGLFMEYLTDSSRKPSERIIAAFGLAGIEDTQLAARAFEKALNQETDPSVRASLVALQALLAGGGKQK